jgi:hypothetical protein
MKKIILFAIVAAAVTMASCRKERTCNCTTTSTYPVGNTTYTSTSSVKITTEKQRKKFFKAHNDCYSTTTTSIEGGGTRTDNTDCTLN